MKENFDYKYGVFARIKKGWNLNQIQFYFEKQGYPYEESWNKKQLVKELKKWEK
tara:strand:- start:52 stop:213 length:162 start_codon:yes stop_codon:yes gene_type:complete